jgi:YHS domain-containing protein
MPVQSFRFLPVCCAVLLLALGAVSGRAAVTSELLVSDRHSGLALYGYDPVSYYIDGQAHAGSARFEMTFAGLTWRFRSEANRAAFRAGPEAYIPGFGGYDPMAVIRGVPVAGHPKVFAVHRDQLYLFTTPESRAEFLRRPEALLEAAKTAWPDVRKTLVP